MPRMCALILGAGLWMTTLGFAKTGELPIISPENDGSFFLSATQAQQVKGNECTPPRLGSVMDSDGLGSTSFIEPIPPSQGQLVWKMNVKTAGRYLATLEFSHGRHGNSFELEVGKNVLTGYVPDTRSSMALMEIGEIELPAGQFNVVLRNTTAFEKRYMGVGSIFIRPLSSKSMTLPEIRHTISRLKPKNIPLRLQMPEIFSDNLVLQRDLEVPIWGGAVAGSEVSVSLCGQLKKTTVEANGRWKVKLDPMVAGGPFTLEVSNGENRLTYSNVLVGEVWFGSGQSNMEVSVLFPQGKETPAQKYECDEDTKRFLESGIDPQIRISSVTRDHHKSPIWRPLSRENVLESPALMSCLAIHLNKSLKVPVGIIVRCESSSSSGIWLSRDVVETDWAIQHQIHEYANQQYPAQCAAYTEAMNQWIKSSEQAKVSGVTLPKKPSVPAQPGDFPFPAFSERRFNHYGANYPTRVAPVIPYSVRGVVWDQGEGGTGIMGVDQCGVMPALVKSWRLAWNRNDLPFFYIRKNQHPSQLWDTMKTIPVVVEVDNRGLGQINHPPDKSAYAQRLFDQIKLVFPELWSR